MSRPVSKVWTLGPPNRAGLRPVIEVRPNGGQNDKKRLPRYVQTRQLASGAIAYYWCRPWWARGPDCPLRNEALGQHLDKAMKRAEHLNARLDDWRESRKQST
jgi:hypothetical protein